jgi:hypothetical protein
LKHLKNDPDQTIPPRRRGRPKTKPNPDQTIKTRKPKTKTVNNITRKELLSQAKDYNIKGYTKWNKQQLLSVVSKAKRMFYKKHDLQKLNKDQLKILLKKITLKLI